MTRQDFGAIVRVVWVEPIAYAFHRDLVEREYSRSYRLVFWGLMVSAACVAGFLLTKGWG